MRAVKASWSLAPNGLMQVVTTPRWVGPLPFFQRALQCDAIDLAPGLEGGEQHQQHCVIGLRRSQQRADAALLGVPEVALQERGSALLAAS